MALRIKIEYSRNMPPSAKSAAGPSWLSPVRRIDRVCTRERVCAVTINDGPCRLPANPDLYRGKALTAVLAETLERYQAKGTFFIIGSPGDCCPDKPNRAGSPLRSGQPFGHLPVFGQDLCGGAANCPELIGRLLAGGHELGNHSYAHLPSDRPLSMMGRKILHRLDAVVADLEKLQALTEGSGAPPLRLARPPRGIESIRDGFTCYDAYALKGYQYIAASYDCSLPLTLASLQEESAAMWRPMEQQLLEDPNAFRGQIISLYDGFNAAGRSPAAEGLSRQLQLLTDHGYRIVPVSRLLEIAPFRDVELTSEVGRAARRLMNLGWCVVYQDNCLRPGAVLTRGELAMMVYGWESARHRVALIRSGRAPFRDMAPRHPYAAAAAMADATQAIPAAGGRFRPDAPASAQDIKTLCAIRLGRVIPQTELSSITHGNFFLLLSRLLSGDTI